MISSLEGVGLCTSRAFFWFCTCQFLSFFSSSLCRGLAATYDCGTPCTFLLCFMLLFFTSECLNNNAQHDRGLLVAWRAKHRASQVYRKDKYGRAHLFFQSNTPFYVLHVQ